MNIDKNLMCVPSSSVCEGTEEKSWPQRTLLCIPYSYVIPGSDLGMKAQKKLSRKSRRKREFIPEERKDANYWDKRKKNNEAAKKSREKRRIYDFAMERRLMAMMEENSRLKNEVMDLKIQCGIIKDPSQYLFPSFMPNIWHLKMAPSGLPPVANPVYTPSLLLKVGTDPTPSKKELFFYPLNETFPNVPNMTDSEMENSLSTSKHPFQSKKPEERDNCEDADPDSTGSPRCTPTITMMTSEDTPCTPMFKSGSSREVRGKQQFSEMSYKRRFPEYVFVEDPAKQFIPSMPSECSAFSSLLPTAGHELKRNSEFSWGNPISTLVSPAALMSQFMYQ